MSRFWIFKNIFKKWLGIFFFFFHGVLTFILFMLPSVMLSVLGASPPNVPPNVFFKSLDNTI
jgi:hypothetical protein